MHHNTPVEIEEFLDALPPATRRCGARKGTERARAAWWNGMHAKRPESAAEFRRKTILSDTKFVLRFSCDATSRVSR